jgi:hypothetical protein
MRKIITITTLITVAFIFQNCGSSKKTTVAAPAALSNEKDIVGIMKTSCTPCHFPPDGRKEPLDSYEAVSKHITEVIERVKLPQSDMKFMPFKNKKPALSDSAVNVLVQWKEQGMAR